ncbi:MAG: hypothetical protein VX892_07025, partial [Candidatus Thermoplasmatota archaeon]|nr:hypothetical protein [Candidatus Thermoplasmatota archaeon]
MGTCEMCGSERVSTLLSEISGTRLRCCNRCIESNNLNVLETKKAKVAKPRSGSIVKRTYTRNVAKM